MSLKIIDTCTKIRTVWKITKDRLLLLRMKIPELNVEASKPVSSK